MYPYRTSNNHHSREQKSDNSFRNGAPSARTKPKKDHASSYYVYGKSAAIEFVCDETKKQRINTITMHAASSKSDEERGYDWDNKTIVQLPRSELLSVTAILLGLTDRGEFNQTGLHASKSFTVEFQNEKVFFMVMERGKPIRAVGLSPEDTYQVVGLFLKQLKQNSPWFTINEIIDLIEMTVVRMKAARDERVSAQKQLDDDTDAELPDYAEDEELAEEAFEPNFNF